MPEWTLMSSKYMPHFTSPLTKLCSAMRDKSINKDTIKPTVHARPFLKLEEGNPFYVLLVLSALLFPQFKGTKPPGVVRAKRQQGMSLSTLQS